MHPLLAGLTPSQRLAVETIDGPLLILAGPGSGKTRVITHRIAWLLEQGVSGRQILALTFTNKAADEMRARVARLAPDHQVWLGTFHRFCARVLRQYAPLVGLKENFTIYDSDAALAALRAAIDEAGETPASLAPESLAEQISRWKNNLIGPDDRGQFAGRCDPLFERVYCNYVRRLLRCNAVDFDDLLWYTATLLRDHPELRSRLDQRYAYVMVDEYQDTNFAQYAIARALSLDHPNLAVTGDPDQSIYGWRGANLRNILDFERDFPGVRVIRLEQNYRSTQRILRAASELIRHNVHRKEKELYTENGEGAPVRLVMHPTERDEAEAVARVIDEAVRSGKRRYSDFAVFYRVNALSRAIETALHEAAIPYQMVNGLAFYQRKEIRDVLSYLQLVENPSDDIAMLRVLNTPARGIGKATIAKLSHFALRRGTTLFEAARQAHRVEGLGKRAAATLAGFVALVDRLANAAVGPLEETLGLVLSESGYRTMLEDSTDPTAQDRLDNIDELLTVARQFDERRGTTGSLGDFLEETCLVNDTDAWEQSADRVTLMTLHASKGLEFPVVFLIAVEEGILPHERGRRDPLELEEERRLMFVGLTRAQEELHISWSRCRDFRGQRRFTIPSHFLMELPRDEMQCDIPGEYSLASPDEQPDAPPTTDDELEIAYDAPVAPPEIEPLFSPPSAATKSPMLAGITTAAELLQGRAAPPPSPEVFRQGMVVRHPEFGLGTIVALSGSGLERTATVEFSPEVGRQRITIHNSPLRPVKVK